MAARKEINAAWHQQWATIPVSVLEDRELSWRARGMLAYLSNRMTCTVKELVMASRNQVGTVEAILTELANAGYLVEEEGSWTLYMTSTGRREVAQSKKAPRDVTQDVYTDGFNACWSIYPIKVGKWAAFAVWHRLGLERYAETIRASIEDNRTNNPRWKPNDLGVRYIPHFRTFLNQRRWEDDIKTEISTKPHDGHRVVSYPSGRYCQTCKTDVA